MPFDITQSYELEIHHVSLANDQLMVNDQPLEVDQKTQNLSKKLLSTSPKNIDQKKIVSNKGKEELDPKISKKIIGIFNRQIKDQIDEHPMNSGQIFKNVLSNIFFLKERASPNKNLGTLFSEILNEFVEKHHEWFSNNIQYCNIKDQTDRVEIAKLCAQQNVEKTAKNIKNFDIKNEADLIEIAKLCAQQDDGWITPAYIQNFDIKNEADLIEIAKLCAQRYDGWITPAYIQNFDIKNEADSAEIAKLCAQQDRGNTAEYIKNFNIKDEATLIEIAKLCVQHNGKNTAEYIQKFGIENKAALVEIAKLCAQQDGENTARHIQEFGIEDKAALIEIAKLCAQHDDIGFTARHIQEFGIEDKAALVEIAKLCAQQDGENTANYIQKFGIEDKAALIEIAKLCAQQAGGMIAKYIQEFGIEDKAALIEIAKLCAQKYIVATARHIQEFGIEDKAALVEIAKLCAQHEGGNMAEYIQNFGIEDKAALIEIAKLCAQQAGGMIAKYIQNFDIKNEVDLIEIAKLCAQQAGGMMAKYIQNFGITDPHSRWEVFLIAINPSTNSISTEDQINKFQIPKNKYPLIELFKTFCSENTEKAPQQGFTELEKHLKNEGFSNEVLEILKRGNDRIHQKSNGVLFTYILAQIDRLENKAQIFNNLQPVLKEVFEYRAPAMRTILINTLVKELQRGNGLDYYNELVNINPKFKSKNLLAIVLLEAPKSNSKDCFKLNPRSNKIFKDSKNLKLLLSTYHAILDLEELTDDEKTNQLRIIQSGIGEHSKQDLRSMLLSLQSIANLAPKKLKNINMNEIEAIYIKAFKEKIPIGEVEDFVQKYDKTFNKMRNPSALLSYASGLSHLFDKDEMLECLASFVKLVLEQGDVFNNERYKPEGNPHLEKVFEGRAELKKSWRQGDECSLSDIQAPSEISIDLKDFLETEILKNKHLDHKKYPLLIEYLKGDAQALEQLNTIVKSKEISPEKKIYAEIQRKCIWLIKNRDLAEELSKLLEKQDPRADFLKDLHRIKNDLQTNKKNQKLQDDYQVVDTDNYWDLFLSGTDVKGSCQMVYGDPDLNKCLLAYVMDGKNRLLAIKRPDGRIEARAIFRLLYDTTKKEPVLFMEEIYANTPGRYDEALLNMAKKRAKALGLTLLGSHGQKEYKGTATSLGNSIPYEYVDAAGKGVISEGEFKIYHSFVLTQ